MLPFHGSALPRAGHIRAGAPPGHRVGVVCFAGRPKKSAPEGEGGGGGAEEAAAAAAAPKRRGRPPRKASEAAAEAAAAAPAPEAAAAATPAAAPAPAPRKAGGRRRATAGGEAPAAAAAAAGVPATPAPSAASLSPAPSASPSAGFSTAAAAGSAPASASASGGGGGDVYYFEGGDVTASQELDAIEGDAASRLHLGFSDPMHSMEDLTFHHDEELLPPGALLRGRGARGRAAESEQQQQQRQQQQRQQQQRQQQQPEPAAAAATAGPAATGAAKESGWAKWRQFKAGTLPPEEMAYYQKLQEGGGGGAAGLPDWLAPANARELARMRWNLEFQDKLTRTWEQEDYQDQAYAIHHYQNETGINRYLTTRQLAGYLAKVELEDHLAPNPAAMRFTSYARAEHRWAHDYDAFNDYLAEHMEEHVIKLPPGAEDAEDIDILDDVLLLSDDKEGAALASGATAGAEGAGEAGGEGEGAATGLDQWLVGVLPGGGAGAAASQQYAEDILGEEGADDDMDAA